MLGPARALLALGLPLLPALAPAAGLPPAPKLLVAVPIPRIVVPAGTFPMGASAEEIRQARALCGEELRAGGALMADLPGRCGARFDAEGPEGEVFLPAFALDRHEVTVGEYAACVRARKCRDSLDVALGGDPRLPVERVTWDEAAAFCRTRGGRLPTEAEWEKAARGPTERAWSWGHDWTGGRANHGRAERLGGPSSALADDPLDAGDGFALRAPVGSFPAGASPYGALDMAGNVWEWTASHFAREPPQSTLRVAPLGPISGTERTIRGGGYRSPPSDLRTTRRTGLSPHERQPAVGFRCAYTLRP